MTDVLSGSPVTYGGTYRAVCLEVLDDRVRVQIPQIFATEVIPIFDFAGIRPVAGANGWVTFENGMAEYPVWAGTESWTETPFPPVPNEVVVGSTAPTVTTGEPELWVDTTVPTTPVLKTWNGSAWIAAAASPAPLAPGGMMPVGSIIAFAGPGSPAGWFRCDGGAYNRITYADLFAAIGTAHGAGDGSTTFNVPNMVGRVAVGRDTGQTEFASLGQAGGTKLATMPNHSHGGTVADGDDRDHTHGVAINSGGRSSGHYHDYGGGWLYVLQTGSGGGGSGFSIVGGDRSITSAGPAGDDRDHIHGVNGNTGGISTGHLHHISAEGSGNNLQPYTVINYLIRYSASALV